MELPRCSGVWNTCPMGGTEASGVVQNGEERVSVGQNSLLIAVLYKGYGARLFIVMRG